MIASPNPSLPAGKAALRWPRLHLRSLFLRRGRRSALRAAALGQGESGQALIEFAITFSVLMAFFFTLIEVCLAFYTYGVISEVAREGTRYASMRGTTCQNSAGASCTATAASITSYVTGIGYPNLGGGTITVLPSFPDAGASQTPGSHVKVQVNYTFRILLPFVPRNSLALTTYSEATILQ